jgi:transcriptional regulator with XRE-family HTH domain
MNSIWSPSYVLLRAKLREMREQAGITQVQLAMYLGKPQSYVSKVESGERQMDFLEVRDYCVACKRDFAEFVTTFEALLAHTQQAGKWTQSV